MMKAQDPKWTLLMFIQNFMKNHENDSYQEAMAWIDDFQNVREAEEGICSFCCHRYENILFCLFLMFFSETL